jgi:hypothetical protein
MAQKVRVAVVLPVTPAMLESIRGVSDRLDVTYLSVPQRPPALARLQRARPARR